MKKCIYCNCNIDDDSVFCTSCGKELPKQKKCIKCGKFTDDDCDWCTLCGAKLIDEPKEIKIEQPLQHKKSKNKLLVALIILSICIVTSAIIFFFVGHNTVNSDSEESLADTRIADSSKMQPMDDSNRISDSATEEVSNDNQATAESDQVICPEPRCGGNLVTNLQVKASNTMPNNGTNNYSASNLLDDNSETIWATPFTGKEEALIFLFNKINGLYKMELVNGHNKSPESFEDNSRAKDIKVYVNGTLVAQEALLGSLYHWPEWITFNIECNNVHEVKIIISSVYEGKKWNDLCISNIMFYTKE